MINTNKILICPSILSADFANMEKSIRDIEEWGGDLIHCDVMDGVYVKNLTFGMPMISAIRRVTTLPLDVHLMITKPERYIEDFVCSGANIVTFHAEASECPIETLMKIRELGAKSGIVFNPDVEIDDYKHLFPFCDMILIMSVYAGLGGQKFIEDSIEKIKSTSEILKKMNIDIPIQVDGGINEENCSRVIEAGGSILVAGSSIFKAKDPKAMVKKLRM